MLNPKIAAIFYEMADLLDILQVEWKPQAFRKAARVIESLPEDVEQTYKKGGMKALLEIDSVGKNLGNKIEEFIQTGKMKEYDELKKQVPTGVSDMLRVQGLGPKKVARLYHELKIDSLKKLETMAKQEKIRMLNGFGEKSEEDILMGLALVKKGTERKLLGMVFLLAEEMKKEIEIINGVEKVEIAGSLRRMRETVKDMDLLVFTEKQEDVGKALQKLSMAKKATRAGKELVSIQTNDGISADLRMLPAKLCGSGLIHFTGSKDHGIAIRNRAIKKGMKFSEYGLMKGTKTMASDTEENVYHALGLEWIPPELRENNGEIEAAEAKKLPQLVELKDIRGDLHAHTRWSDGSNTSEEMIRKAIEKKYEYVAITDHSKSDVVANGLDVKRAKEHMKELETLQKKFPAIHILKGSEVAILANGKMDYDNAVLKELDIVIGSIHSGFKSDKDKMTQRLISALENEHLDFIAHPTGRLINQRNPYSFDLEKVLDAAEKNGKGMEINAHPSRLDFDAQHIRMCVERKIPLVINTDAHSVSGMDYMMFGVGQARQGWAEKKDIVNTLSFTQFSKKWL